MYPNQTSYELPPKSQANSRSEPIELEQEPDIIPIEPEQVSFLMHPYHFDVGFYILSYILAVNLSIFH